MMENYPIKSNQEKAQAQKLGLREKPMNELEIEKNEKLEKGK